MKIGILSLQGDVSEHVSAMEQAMQDLRLAGDVVEVKNRENVRDVDALVIPGGESTTIGRLLGEYGIDGEIKKLSGRIPIMGTCAGLILLGKGNSNSLGLMDVKVRRNAFGCQRESFEAGLKIPRLGGGEYNAVFIRAPVIEDVGDDVEVLAEYKGRIVMAQEGRLIAVAFHPELTPDMRIHKYFLKLLLK